MSVLARSELMRLIEAGKLKVEPFRDAQVGAGSIDLHLGSDFRVFRKARGVFQVTDDSSYAEITEAVRVEDGGHLLVMPGQLVHGITKERVTLPENVAAFIEGRSSLARIGLLTHLSSGFIHPGTSNRTVLEIANISPIRLAITPGMKICQLVLLSVKGSGRYAGRFAHQSMP
ncbi:MAG: dCTP deaminase [Nitrososphaerales archaeon]|jgi:dCTP deaminase